MNKCVTEHFQGTCSVSESKKKGRNEKKLKSEIIGCPVTNKQTNKTLDIQTKIIQWLVPLGLHKQILLHPTSSFVERKLPLQKHTWWICQWMIKTVLMSQWVTESVNEWMNMCRCTFLWSSQQLDLNNFKQQSLKWANNTHILDAAKIKSLTLISRCRVLPMSMSCRKVLSSEVSMWDSSP